MPDSLSDKDMHAHAEALLGLAVTADEADGDCPDEETIVAWHEGALKSPVSESVQHHVAHCDSCYMLWTGLLQAESLEPDTQAATSTPVSLFPDWLRGLMTTRALAAGAVAAVAGGLLFNVMTSAPPLPNYGLLLDGRTKIVRGPGSAATAVAVFDVGNRFRLLLTPTTSISDNVDARLYIVRDSTIQTIAVPIIQITAKGVVLIEGTVGPEVALPAGQADLIVVVGRASKLPSATTLLARLQDTAQIHQDQWTAWKIAIRVE